MKKIISILALLASVQSMAALTEQQKTYAMFCGSKADLQELADAEGDIITSKDIIELNKSRKEILNVLATGNKGIQAILKEGSASDTGPFGALMTCGVIEQLKTEITTEGCYDLKTNKAVRDNGGIKACRVLLAKLPK